MSTFLAKNRTINHVTTWINDYTNDYNGHWFREQLQKIDIDMSALGRAMYELNCAAVDARYGEANSRTTGDTYEARREVTSKIQVYKSLVCFLYQCSEGDIPDAPLFQLLDRHVKDELAFQIISELPQYDRCAWD